MGCTLLANEVCMQIVRGWLMASKMPLAEKLTVVSRLANYQAMWGEKTIPQIPAVKRLMTQADLVCLDHMLRCVKKPQE